MNRIDIVNWVGLNDTEKKNATTFRSIVDESSSSDAKTKWKFLSSSPDLKLSAFMESIFLFKEDVNGEKEQQPNSGRDMMFSSWQNFRSNVETMAQLLGLDQTGISEKFNQMEDTFKLISGDADTGFKQYRSFLEKVDSSLQGLKPKLHVWSIFDALSKKGYGGDDYIAFFRYMTQDRQLSFTKLLNSDKPTIKEFFISELKEMGIEPDSILRCFSSLTSMKNFTKNNVAVGKGEIAIALLFGDCKLAGGEGDIDIDGEKYEIKGQNGSITARLPSSMFPPKLFNGISVDDVLKLDGQIPKSAYSLVQNEPKGIEEVKNVIDTISKMDSEGNSAEQNGDENRKEEEKSKPQDSWKNALKFIVLFSYAFKNYPQKYSLIVGINTSNEKQMFSRPLLKIPYPSGNWIECGRRTLKMLNDNRISVRFGTISSSSEVTFKIYFRSIGGSNNN